MNSSFRHPANLAALQRRLAVAAVAIAMAGGTPYATAAGDMNRDRQRPDGPPSPERMQERLQQDLGISADQATQVARVLQDERTRHDAVHQEAMAALAKFLTPEQVAKIDSRRPRGPQGPEEEGRAPAAGGRP